MCLFIVSRLPFFCSWSSRTTPKHKSLSPYRSLYLILFKRYKYLVNSLKDCEFFKAFRPNKKYPHLISRPVSPCSWTSVSKFDQTVTHQCYADLAFNSPAFYLNTLRYMDSCYQGFECLSYLHPNIVTWYPTS